MFLLLVFAIMMQAPVQPSMPKILLIAREPIRPGAETGYDRIESDTARLAVKFACPHPYLALEPLSGAKNEVWWLNWFASREEVEWVGEAYKKNAAWNAALTKNQKLKERLTEKPSEQFVDYKPQADSQPWAAGRAPYVVVAINPATHLHGSNAFLGRDGTRYELLMMNTRQEAERAALGSDCIVLEVVPRWSFPATEWVDAAPGLWHAKR
jgi:hypothetical protein